MNIIEQCTLCKNSATALALSSAKQRNSALRSMAQEIIDNTGKILEANKIDMEKAEKSDMKRSMLDRLLLTEERIKSISAAILKIVNLPDPIGKGDIWQLSNGLNLQRVRVPIGVIAIIYESRPNVTADAAALCIKSGNGVVLRGGSDAFNSNVAIAEVLRKSIEKAGLPCDAIQIVGNTARETATQLMRAKGLVDLLIPRGGKDLIRSVVDNAIVPVIETGAGNCHIYVEASADFEKAVKIIVNAKTSRPSVCNSMEQLLVDRDIAVKLLPLIKSAMPQVIIKGDGEIAEIIEVESITEEDYYTEYNDFIMNIKIVKSVEEAVERINKYGTAHSDAIITESIEKADYFTKAVDSAAVYVNASTRFTDGEEFGFGAEIGISNQKLHARGPLGLTELTTVKLIAKGNGQIR